MPEGAGQPREPGQTLKANVLDHHQAIISRLAGSSSSLKGWAVSIAMAFIGFAAKDGPRTLAFLALLPLLILWLLDSHYLASERIYRERFNAAASEPSPKSSIDGVSVAAAQMVKAMFTMVNLGVYLSLAALASVIGFGWVGLSGRGG